MKLLGALLLMLSSLNVQQSVFAGLFDPPSAAPLPLNENDQQYLDRLNSFHDAIRRNDLGAVEEFLQEGMDPNVHFNLFGDTAVTIAEMDKNAEMIALLSKYKGSACNENFTTPAP